MSERKTVYIRAPDGKVMAYDSPPGGRAVHSTKETVGSGEVGMALWEQLFNIKGPTFIARFLAERLREPAKYPGISEVVANLLDPDVNTILTRGWRMAGKSWTRALMTKRLPRRF